MAGNVVSEEEILYHNSFVYDKPDFKPYLRLHMRPHDRYTGWRCMGCFSIFALIFGVFICAMTTTAAGVWFGRKPDTGVMIAGLLFIGSLLLVIYGFYRFQSREPRRSEEWWDSWATQSLVSLREKWHGETPCPPGAEFFFVVFSSMLFLLKVTMDRDNHSCYVSVTPFKAKNLPESVDAVAFDAFFSETRILKGSSRGVFVKDYSEVYDIVEHPQVPGWALIRNKDAEELLIKTDAFENDVCWDEVKAFILRRRKEEISPFVSKKKKKPKGLKQVHSFL